MIVLKVQGGGRLFVSADGHVIEEMGAVTTRLIFGGSSWVVVGGFDDVAGEFGYKPAKGKPADK